MGVDREVKRAEMTTKIDGTQTESNVWLYLAGGGTAAAVFVFVSIILVVYIKRKRSKAKGTDSTESSIVGHVCGHKIPLSSYTSSSSADEVDLSYPYPTIPSPKRMALIQSPSVDIPAQLKANGSASGFVSRPPSLPRWHSMGNYYPSTVIGKVQPDLYRGSDDDEPNSPPCGNGRLWFSVAYDEPEVKLKVTVIKAKYLPGRGYNNNPRDPFVRLYLLPDEEHYEQTKARKRTLSPKFNEVLHFQVTKEELATRTLRLSMYDIDKRKVRHSLGHIFVILSKIDVTSGEILSRDLETSCQPSSVGELQLTLSCNPMTNRLKAVVGRLKNVRGIDNGEAGLYTRVQLFHGHKLMKTKKTNLRHHNKEKDEVVFDEAFNFAVASKYFDSFSINFTVVISGPTPLVKDQPIGKLVVGPFMYSRGDPLLHWQEMLSNPRSLVTRWHTLEESNL